MVEELSPSSSILRWHSCCPDMINGCSGFLIVGIIGVLLPGGAGQGGLGPVTGGSSCNPPLWLPPPPEETPSSCPCALGEQGFPHLKGSSFKVNRALLGGGNEAETRHNPWGAIGFRTLRGCAVPLPGSARGLCSPWHGAAHCAPLPWGFPCPDSAPHSP